MDPVNTSVDIETGEKPESKRLMPTPSEPPTIGQRPEITQTIPANPDDIDIVSEQPDCEECKICGSELTPAFKVSFSQCSHLYCNLCFEDYLTYKLSEKQVEILSCPAFNCPVVLKDDDIRPHLSESDFTKLQRFRYELEIERIPDVRWCPQVNCTGYDIGGLDKRRLVCTACRYEYCFYCLEAWHSAGKCKGEADRKLDRWAKAHNAKFCPMCHMKIEKLKGCDHMTCSKCKYQFCWLCGASFSVAHIAVCPVTVMRRRNPPWYICLMLLLLPILLPFAFVYILFRARQRHLEEESDDCLSGFLRMKVVCFPVIFIFGVVLTPLAFTCFILFTIGAILIRRGIYYQYDSSSCFQCLARRRCLWNWLSVFTGMVLSPVVVLFLVGVAVVAPIVGLGFVVLKGFVLIMRCCGRSDFMMPQGVRGYRVG